jgi:dihydrofolate synthase / folylpolyglutamate synthase
MVELPGRFQIVPGQPVLVLDVAHNPHSVAALAANLDAMGFYPTTHAVLGAMSDKDLLPDARKSVNPMVDKWYFTDLPTAAPRPGRQSRLICSRPGTRKDTRTDTSRRACHADPMQALQAAIEAADPADRIVVFGSFYTVGGVLKAGAAALAAPPRTSADPRSPHRDGPRSLPPQGPTRRSAALPCSVRCVGDRAAARQRRGGG